MTLAVWLTRVAGPLSAILLWQALAMQVGPDWIPAPHAVAVRLAADAASGKLWVDLAMSGALVAAGTVIGLAAGVAIAFSLRISKRIERAMQPYIAAMMSVPKLALVPLVVLWFGTGVAPKVMLVALTVLFITLVVTASGLSSIDRRLVDTARVLGASELQVTRHIVLPTLLPYVLTSLELAAPWSVSAAVVAEYLAATAGVGHAIEQARQVRDGAGLFAGIVAATMLVLMSNALVALLRQRLHARGGRAAATGRS